MVIGESSVKTIRPRDLGFGPLFWRVREALVVGDAASGRIVLWNPAAAALFGYSADEAIGMLLEALIPPHLRAQHRAGLARYAATGRGPLVDAKQPIVLPALRKDGTEIAIELILTSLTSPDDSIATGSYVLANIRDVTERRQVTNENALLAAIVATTDDAVMCVNADGLITAWNSGAERLYGYTAAEAIGQPITMLIPPELHDERNIVFARVMRGEHVDHFDTERLTKHGRRVQVSIAAFAVRDADGAIIGAASIARDITQRRQAEQDQARLAAIVESSEDAIIAIDRDGRITAWNPGAERLYGYAPDEAIGQPGSMLVLPETAAQRQLVLDQILRGEHVDPYEAERLTKDGRRLRIWISSSPVRDVDGAIIGAASIARDITAEREKDARLREIETWFGILADKLPGVVTYLEEIDEDEPIWNMRYMSPQIETMLGFPVALWTDDPDFGPTRVHPEDRDRVMAEDARTEVSEEPYSTEYRMIAKDGRIVWVRDEAVMVRDEADRPKYWLGYTLDISEQKRLEAERADFNRMVAHELGSPIAAIRRSAELLATDALSASQELALGGIQNAVNALRALVDDVVAKRDDFTVHLQPMPVEQLVANAALFGHALPGNCPVTATSSIDDRVLADAERIDQVLRNLLDNAAKYSPPGTPVTISATRHGNKVRIAVADRGPGIPPEDLPSIFEKFARGRDAAERNIPGVGLGLYFSRRIVQAHGSDLTVVSPPGQGTTFAFALEVAP